MLQHHDIVLVGYRGVDGSTSLDCPEVTEAFSSIGDPLAEQSLEDIGDAYLKGFDRLRAEGIDLNSYTMLDVIDDFEAARTALGYDKIHLYSQSYGTRVAYLYGVRYPESVARSVMVGVNPPGHFIWEPDVNDDILRKYCERWNNDPTASLRCPDLEATIRSVLSDPPDSWLVFDIDPNKLRCMMFFMLYHQGSAVQMLDAFVAADNGDYSGLALMCFFFDHMIAGGVNWGDNIAKAMSADFDPSRDYIREMMPKDSVIGSPFSRIVGFMQQRDWPINSIPDEFRRLRTSEVETLMVNGNLDISTPARFARDELLPHLPNGQLVVVSDMGHVGDVEHLQADAFEHLASTFLLTGDVDDSQFRPQPIEFNPSDTLPKQAKKYLMIAVGSGTGILLLLVGASRFAWRRYRRRRIAKSTSGVVVTEKLPVGA
jgi:pimeloyl-ACP methyl ester carboxylesterase